MTRTQVVDRLLGVLNGVVGDHLARTGNGLAIPMQIIRGGSPLPLELLQLEAIVPAPTSRVVVLVHGLTDTEACWDMPGGESYGSFLARDLGYTPFTLRYNTGRHISENGEALDSLLEQLVAAYPAPLDELTLLGHSMGGLVLRSATHAASVRGGSRWLPLARRAIYLGSPHLGAPLERAGNALAWALRKVPDPVSVLLGDLVNLRSSGVKDLRYGYLRQEDWEGADPDALLTNGRHPVPLLPHMRHHLVAGTLSDDPRMQLLFGDALVPVPSATGRARTADRCQPLPQEHVRVMPGMGHLRLTRDLEVYAQIRAWCEREAGWNGGGG
ncbi:lipase family alpha/beta hydrolase [Chondromyces crocatus]|uniref:AB hydrolase-1 domain-containing protein n=1 Tax=Chondromyces crocatus TaxID=52 RepID=A0A0K1ER57_CHOCO|nr:alpha/beta fold hydrolase [Chondromyces crocatus]AKT43083.1 uncharacterized protein CMC5_073110 [Chondromyces crocatus]